MGLSQKRQAGEVATILSYGLIDNADIVIGLPYQWHKVKVDGVVDPGRPCCKDRRDIGYVSGGKMEIL